MTEWLSGSNQAEAVTENWWEEDLMRGSMGTEGLGVVTVRRETLLTAIITNREAHRKEFETALEGYRREAIKQLERMLEDAKGGRQIRVHVNLIQPMDQTKDYDRVIKMLEMSVDEEVELTQEQFSQYVMDDWSWKGQFIASTAVYNATAP